MQIKVKFVHSCIHRKVDLLLYDVKPLTVANGDPLILMSKILTNLLYVCKLNQLESLAYIFLLPAL